jgi:hypothetical protein
MPSDHDLAWALADHIAPDLVNHDKTAIYVDLGCGNGWEAIGHMLNVTVRDQLRLPEALICQIAVWLDGYAGTADEPTLRELLRQLQRREGPRHHDALERRLLDADALPRGDARHGGLGSTAPTSAPASTNCADAMPPPAPTSSAPGGGGGGKY